MTQNVSSVSSDLTLYFLQASRSIRVAWLLEELGLPYKSIFYPREKNKAPASFKSDSGNTLAKAPALKDGDLLLAESGAISEYATIAYTNCVESIANGQIILDTWLKHTSHLRLIWVDHP